MRDFDTYFERMSKNLKEKTEFLINELEHSEYGCVIDFGCANGVLVSTLAEMLPDRIFYGYDTNEEIIKMNKKMNSLPNLHFVNNIEDLSFKDSFLILSSVLHELFSFEEHPEVYFTKFFSQCKLIAIRDMKFTENKNVAELKPEEVEKNGLRNSKLFNRFVFNESSNNKLPQKYSKQFITHYLLKSLYEDNFEEELKENYFATTFGYISILLENKGFHKSYYQEYLNSYLRSKVKELSGFDLKRFTHTTHCKIIYKRY